MPGIADVNHGRTVLVTDGEQRSALAVVRSLGQVGYRCLVTSSSGRSLSGASRYASNDFAAPDPASDPAGYAEKIARIVTTERVDLLIPIGEPALLSLLPVRDRIPTIIPFVSARTFDAICDKERVLTAARQVGISVPRQTVLRSAEDADSVNLPLPVVLKPSRSVCTDESGTRTKVGVRWAYTPQDMRRQLQQYPAAAFPVLAQTAVTGPGIGIFVLLHDNRVIARFSHRRIREKPPTGGVSVVRQSEPMDEDLLNRSLALLETFGWTGVAMIEFKRDLGTGEPFLMEINGRFWGSLQLAIDAGVDFPRLLAAVTFGQPVEPVASYRSVRSRWFWGDVDHTIAHWRKSAHGYNDRFRASRPLRCLPPIRRRP